MAQKFIRQIYKKERFNERKLVNVSLPQDQYKNIVEMKKAAELTEVSACERKFTMPIGGILLAFGLMSNIGLNTFRPSKNSVISVFGFFGLLIFGFLYTIIHRIKLKVASRDLGSTTLSPKSSPGIISRKSDPLKKRS